MMLIMLLFLLVFSGARLLLSLHVDYAEVKLGYRHSILSLYNSPWSSNLRILAEPFLREQLIVLFL